MTLYPMANASQGSVAGSPTIAGALRDLAEAVLRPARRRAAYWYTADQLRALPPRVLKDCFGIEGWQIGGFARRTVAEALPAPKTVGGALRELVRALAAAWGESRRRRAELHLLMVLDDRMLADIGLRRAEIAPLVYGPRMPAQHAPAFGAARAACSEATGAAAGEAEDRIAPAPARIANDDRLRRAS